MNHKVKKPIIISIIAAFVLQLAACGTIMYPERKGQPAGQLDAGIVALNAIGLFFYFIPGVIAFAVDFNNGTIYLPRGSASTNSDELNIVTVDGGLTNKKIEQVILDQTGESIKLSDSNVVSNKKLLTVSVLISDVRFL